MFADMGPNVQAEEVASHLKEQGASKIWQFNSPKKIQLNVLTDSLDLMSKFHKTYKNPGASHNFRDSIKFVLDNFFKVTQIPVIRRVGLRYIDECPVPERTNDAFQEYYNTTFPVSRFAVQDAEEMLFKTVVKKNDYQMRYVEALQTTEKGGNLILDFDAFMNNVKAQDCLTVADTLHDFILEEYEKTIKAPVIAYMRKIG